MAVSAELSKNSAELSNMLGDIHLELDEAVLTVLINSILQAQGRYEACPALKERWRQQWIREKEAMAQLQQPSLNKSVLL